MACSRERARHQEYHDCRQKNLSVVTCDDKKATPNASPFVIPMISYASLPMIIAFEDDKSVNNFIEVFYVLTFLSIAKRGR